VFGYHLGMRLRTCVSVPVASLAACVVLSSFGCGSDSVEAGGAVAPLRDASIPSDASSVVDASSSVDAASPMSDAGSMQDASTPRDATAAPDAGGSVQDASTPRDATAAPDAGGSVQDASMGDASTIVDAAPPRADSAPPTSLATPEERTATTAAMIGEGLDDCGAYGDDVCARSLFVPGGSFARGPDTTATATVSSFRLDKYEVTVGRFRKFFDAWMAGWRPTAGSGKHAHLNGGQGLAVTGGGFESGWVASWSDNVGRPKSNTVNPPTNGTFDAAAWNLAFTNCASSTGGWTATPLANERHPMNCLSWYDAHAFCIWDGGFVPSDAEWEYAAAGGAEDRTYPWGSALESPGYAIAGVTAASPVGTAWRGAGRWGHVDLSGNVREWALDRYALELDATCTDCLSLPAGNYRVYRSPPYEAPLNGMQVTDRNAFWPAARLRNFGVRCARRP
jgi:sulfatase modifying factor 1